MKKIEALKIQGVAFVYATPKVGNIPLHASPVAPAWRPIETAPKDGTSVLIAGGTYYYDAGISDQPYPFGGVKVAYWDRDAWNGGYGSEYDGEYWHKPTVWMPLPVAPREEKP